MKQSQRLKNIVTEPNAKHLFGKVVPASKVLVLSPHCDDEALGFAGNIIKYLKAKTNVKVIFFSNDKEKSRVRETREAWNQYDDLSLEFLGFPDSFIYKYEETAVERIHQEIEAFQPEIVATPWYFDKHIDHVECNIILCRVIEKLLNVGNISVTNIISYEVNFPLYINYFVNISDVFKEKVNVLECYKGQRPEKLIASIEALNRFRAKQVSLRNVKYAEALYICSPKEYLELLKLHINALFRSI